MKTILITGASSGIGHATAKHFLANGWNVVATMRNPTDAKDLESSPHLLVLPLDVTLPESIASAIQQTLEVFGSIDVLLNNAGYGLAGPMDAVTPAQLERQFATNVFGPVYTMQACLPHFRSKRSGLIINVTSVGGRLALPFNSLYHGTKFGLEGISESLALELAPLGVKVKLVEPGGVRTDFAGRSLDFMQKEGLTAYDASLAGALSVFGDPSRATGYSDPSQIAEVIFEAATDGKEQLRYLAGKDAVEMVGSRNKLSDEDYREWAVKEYRL